MRKREIKLMVDKIIFATSNEHKVQEVREMLKKINVKVLSLNDVGLKIDSKETGVTFEENSHIKASDISRKTDIPVIADDSGLCIDAFHGFPGSFSARFLDGHSYIDKQKEILNMLEDIEIRDAHFTCSVTYINKKENIDKTFTAEVPGKIIKEFDEAGQNGGFGYDPIFYSLELKKTFGRATEEEKNSVSHRGRAIAKFVQFLEENN